MGQGTMIAVLCGLAVYKAGLVAIHYMHLGSETRWLRYTIYGVGMIPVVYALVLIAEGAWRRLRNAGVALVDRKSHMTAWCVAALVLLATTSVGLPPCVGKDKDSLSSGGHRRDGVCAILYRCSHRMGDSANTDTPGPPRPAP